MADHPTPATPPPAAVPEHPDEPLLTLLADRCRCPAPVLLRGDDLDDDRCVTCVAIARIRRLRAALAAAERERDEAREQLRRRCIDIEHLHDERERSLLAERDAARTELAEANAALREEMESFCYYQEQAREAEAVLRAERDAARAEVERAFRAGCLAPVGALTASDEVIDRAWAAYRQQRAAAEDAKEETDGRS